LTAARRVAAAAARPTTGLLWLIALSPALCAAAVWAGAAHLDLGAAERDGTRREWLSPAQVCGGGLGACAACALLLGTTLITPAGRRDTRSRLATALVGGLLAVQIGPALHGLVLRCADAGDWRFWLPPLALAGLRLLPGAAPGTGTLPVHEHPHNDRRGPDSCLGPPVSPTRPANDCST